MAASSNILREYLVSLGYSVDGASQRKFDTSLGRTDGTVKGLLKSLIGATTAAQVFVAAWSRSMEQLYYSSRKAETAAGVLQALDFGGRNIGIDNIKSSIEGMARALRQNPGLTGLIESLGVQVTGRDKGKVMIDMIKQLKQMPFYVGSQYASLFGIGPDEYLLLTEGVDKLEAAALAREKMAAAAGLDVDAAAKAGVEYANQLRDIGELFVILKDVAAINLLPPFKDVAATVKEIMKDWIWIIGGGGNPNASGGVLGRIKEVYVPQIKALFDNVKQMLPGPTVTHTPGGEKKNTPSEQGAVEGPGSSANAPPAPTNAQSFLNGLERTYGLPPGMLDKIWKQESGRGVNKGPSKAGATGDFQFMPNTKKEFNAGDTFESQADAAARKIRGLLKRYGGDDQLAAMAYNLGEGNLDKVLKGQRGLPDETRKYGEAISGRSVTVQQNTTIQVASDDPATAGRSVSREQFRVNEQLGSVVRNQTANAS